MTDIFKLSDSEKQARKQNALNLNVTRANQVRYGERSLRDLGPEIWYNLPAHIKSAPNLLSFKHLFKSWDGTPGMASFVNVSYVGSYKTI